MTGPAVLAGVLATAALAALPAWTTDTAAILVAIGALLTIIGILARWVRVGILQLVDTRLAEIRDELLAHMNAEDRSLEDVARSLRLIAEHVGFDPDDLHHR